MSEPVCADVHRVTLQAAVASILAEVGFDAADKMAMETLCEMAQSFVTALGDSSRAYCELASRSEPVIGDVIMSLVNLGIPVHGIESHAKRTNRLVLPPLQPSVAQKQPLTLTAGTKQSLPPHIPDSFPALPDPHAYIRTPTHKQPVTEYEAIREKAAMQKRYAERALTRLVAKTGERHALFASANTNLLFPLIATKCSQPPYLDALLPRDQVFDTDEMDLAPIKVVKESSDDKSGEPSKPNDSDTIDNPYLRSVKMPKKSK